MKNQISKEEYINCLSSEHSLFKVLSKPEFELLCKHITFNHFKKNDIIYREGDMPMGLLCLCFGKVKIFKEGETLKWPCLMEATTGLNFL